MMSGGRDRKDIPDDWCCNVKAPAIKFWSVAQPYLHVEPRFDRIEMSATEMQTFLKYAGPEPRTQSKAVSATLNCV